MTALALALGVAWLVTLWACGRRIVRLETALRDAQVFADRLMTRCLQHEHLIAVMVAGLPGKRH
jgi:hypothetical protein